MWFLFLGQENPYDNTNLIIFKENRKKKKFNLVLKESLGFARPYFALNLHILQPYCSRILIFVGTYFGLIFRNITKSIYVNNARSFV